MKLLDRIIVSRGLLHGWQGMQIVGGGVEIFRAEPMAGGSANTAANVQSESANDLAKLLTSGFEAVSTNRASVELPKPNITAVLNARMWKLRYCSEPGVWISTKVFNSTRNMVLPGLTPGTLYTIEACALGGKTGASEWSDAVSHRSL